MRPDWNETALVELRSAYGQNCFRQIDIRHSEAHRLCNTQTESIQKNEQCAEGRRVQLHRAPPSGHHGVEVEEAAQLVAGVYVRRRRRGRLRLVVWQRRTRHVT